MATHSSILARIIPRTEESGGLQSMGSQRVRHNWICTHWNFEQSDVPLMGFHKDTETNNKLIFKLYLPGQELEIVKSCWWIQWNNEDSGVSTGNCVCVCVHGKSIQSCPTLCDPIDYSPPASSIHGILQAKILEWVAMPSSRGFSPCRDRPCLLFLMHWQAASLPLAPPGKHCCCSCSVAVPSFPPALIFPSIRIFSNESALRIMWPKYWSFSFSISPSNEYPGLISFRIDWFDLLAVKGTLKSLLQHHSLKPSILWCMAAN